VLPRTGKISLHTLNDVKVVPAIISTQTAKVILLDTHFHFPFLEYVISASEVIAQAIALDTSA
jgi:hypothetical protein